MKSAVLAILMFTMATAVGCGSDDDSKPSGGNTGALGQPGAACSDSDQCMCIVCECDGEEGGTAQGCSSGKCDTPEAACQFSCGFTGGSVTGARVGTAAECAE